MGFGVVATVPPRSRTVRSFDVVRQPAVPIPASGGSIALVPRAQMEARSGDIVWYPRGSLRCIWGEIEVPERFRREHVVIGVARQIVVQQVRYAGGRRSQAWRISIGAPSALTSP